MVSIEWRALIENRVILLHAGLNTVNNPWALNSYHRGEGHKNNFIVFRAELQSNNGSRLLITD